MHVCCDVSRSTEKASFGPAAHNKDEWSGKAFTDHFIVSTHDFDLEMHFENIFNMLSAGQIKAFTTSFIFRNRSKAKIQ